MGDDHGPRLEIKEGFFRLVRPGEGGPKTVAQSWADEGPTERDLFYASDIAYCRQGQ